MSVLSITKHLLDIGCCPRCILMLLGNFKISDYATNETVIDSVEKTIDSWEEKTQSEKREDSATNLEDTATNLEDCATNMEDSASNMDTTNMETTTHSRNSTQVTGHVSKHDILSRVKEAFFGSVCVSCLGLQQDFYLQDSIIDELVGPVLTANYDSSSFLLSVTLPACIVIRCSAVTAVMRTKGGGEEKKDSPDRSVTFIKDVWKSRGGPLIASKLQKKFSVGDAPLTVSVTLNYENDNAETAHFMQSVGFSGSKKKKQRDYKRFRFRKQTNEEHNPQQSELKQTEYSRMSLTACLSEVKDEVLLQASSLTPLSEGDFRMIAAKSHHCPIFVAGRYCKYSRNLSQSPWFIDGQSKTELSVEEHIVGQLKKAFQPRGEYKFLSSGREDVDVRCLGRGRPFAFEIRDPLVTLLDASAMARIQQKINEATQEIQVSHLQLLESKECTSVLRFNTEEKVKSYTALCLMNEGEVTEELLDRLRGVTPLLLQQETPMRVLHRRPLLTRPRTVHTIKVHKVDAKLFKLHLRTESGTYIKEFVHGDFGRTQPNVSTMLGCACDIIALDVEDVEVDWPPEL